ncbi:hypothetical protein CLV84_3859 [Neolewinella xylanilytica]|uniref:Uncharacterized protein n=1 Tax=Neolewinella xylanilytica TaxID=1514080 RepID=A0A2S6I154_9BACT|nr:hypothetical protein [Neolewinella xylanilytica]PPK84697.1 hypothetical protein CLV84_3859 [Neolewinella xylanilytica]
MKLFIAPLWICAKLTICSLALALIPYTLSAQFPDFYNYDPVDIYKLDTVESALLADWRREDSAITIDTEYVETTYAYTLYKEAKARRNQARRMSRDRRLYQRPALSDLLSEQANRTLELKRKELYFDSLMTLFTKINRMSPKPRGGDNFFPVMTPRQARFFYNEPDTSNIDFISNVILQTNIDQTASKSDIISGNLLMLRADISTAVAQNSDTTKEASFDNILYGGLLNGKLTFPVIFASGPYMSFYLPVGFKASYNNYTVKSEEERSENIFFRELFASAYLRIPLTNTRAKISTSFFFNAEFAHVSGNSRFYASLPDISSAFTIVRGTAGFEVKKSLRMAINFPLYLSIDSVPELEIATVGFQIDPARLAD